MKHVHPSNAEEFITALNNLGNTKLVLALPRDGNQPLIVHAEIRYMPTAGGYKWAYANIDSWNNQRSSGQYFDEPYKVWSCVIDNAPTNKMLAAYHAGYNWYEVPDSEHTVDSFY